MGLYDQQPRAGKGLVLPFTKASNSEANQEDSDYRLPLLHRVPDSVRNHFVAMTGEFVGTVLFLYFALSGTQVANSIPSSAGLTVAQTGSNPQQLQYIALCFGFSLAVNAWVFFRISGGLFNPAVTIGMCLIGALPWIRGVLLFIAQILGGKSGLIIDLSVRLKLTYSSRHGRGCTRILHVSRRSQCPHQTRRWHLGCPRSLHRDDPDGRARVCDIHVGGGETQGNLHRTSGHRISRYSVEFIVDWNTCLHTHLIGIVHS